MGGSPRVQVGFEYRQITADDVSARSTPWSRDDHAGDRKRRGRIHAGVEQLAAWNLEVHAIVRHPLRTIYGADLPMH